jgi:eukaryotic-like serine/threonine-protein kinase
MKLGSSMRRRRGQKDEPSWLEQVGGAGNGGDRDAGGGSRLALIAAAVAVIGTGVGWVVATRVVFPPPPPPGDLYEVPDLYDMELGEATHRLEDAGLSLGAVDQFQHPAVDSGRVMGQDPLPGQLAVPGRAVRLSVSMGAELRAIPEVGHLRGDQARTRLEESGFVVQLDSVDSDEPRGRVVSLDPPAGTHVGVPAEVRLRVSVGPPQVSMPPLLGLPESQARDSLEVLGFELSAVEDQFGFEAEDGKIVGQDPSPGVVVDRGSRVRLVIGRRGPRRDTIPGGP